MSKATKPVGASGLEEWHGQINEDFLTSWGTLTKRVKNIDQMMKNSAVVGALRTAIIMPIKEVDWTVTNGDEIISLSNPQVDGITDERLILIADSINNMQHTFSDHLEEALLTPFFGFTVFTDNYDRVDGRLLWKKLKMLSPKSLYRWQFKEDDDSEIEGIYQMPHIYKELIPENRLIHYTFRRIHSNPEGESILRPAWISYYYSSNIQEIEAIGIERNVAGLPVLEMPQGADSKDGSEDRTLAEKIVRNIRMDEQAGVVLPPPNGDGENDRWRLSLLSAASISKVFDTNLVIARHDKRILMSSLAQFLMLGMESVGALATFEGGNDFFTAAVNMVAKSIAHTFTKEAIHKLLRLNGYDTEGIMTEYSPPEDIELEQLAGFLNAVAPHINFTPEDEIWLRSILRMPEKTVEQIEETQMEKEQKENDKLDKEHQNALAIKQAMANQPGQEDQFQVESNQISDNAPDDSQRIDHANSFYHRAVSYFQGALGRVENSAEKMVNVADE